MQNGEEVILTSRREKTPVARLVPIPPVVKKRLGLLYNPDFVLADSFWDPLPEGWEGEGDRERFLTQMPSSAPSSIHLYWVAQQER